MPKKPRARGERREHERAARKRVRELKRLAELEPGGSSDRPIDVVSSSVVEVRARSIPCPLCAGSLRLEEETAEQVLGRSLRAAHVVCVRCGVARTIWFRLTSPLPN